MTVGVKGQIWLPKETSRAAVPILNSVPVTASNEEPRRSRKRRGNAKKLDSAQDCAEQGQCESCGLSFFPLPPSSSPPSWGGAGEHSWAPASPLWALIPYSCAPCSLIPSLRPPPLSRSSGPFLPQLVRSDWNIFHEQLTKWQTQTILVCSNTETQICEATAQVILLRVTRVPARQRQCVVHTKCTAVNVYRKSPLALPSSFFCEPRLKTWGPSIVHKDLRTAVMSSFPLRETEAPSYLILRYKENSGNNGEDGRLINDERTGDRDIQRTGCRQVRGRFCPIKKN